MPVIFTGGSEPILKQTIIIYNIIIADRLWHHAFAMHTPLQFLLTWGIC